MYSIACWEFRTISLKEYSFESIMAAKAQEGEVGEDHDVRIGGEFLGRRIGPAVGSRLVFGKRVANAVAVAPVEGERASHEHAHALASAHDRDVERGIGILAALAHELDDEVGGAVAVVERADVGDGFAVSGGDRMDIGLGEGRRTQAVVAPEGVEDIAFSEEGPPGHLGPELRRDDADFGRHGLGRLLVESRERERQKVRCGSKSDEENASFAVGHGDASRSRVLKAI